MLAKMLIPFWVLGLQNEQLSCNEYSLTLFTEVMLIVKRIENTSVIEIKIIVVTQGFSRPLFFVTPAVHDFNCRFDNISLNVLINHVCISGKATHDSMHFPP